MYPQSTAAVSYQCFFLSVFFKCLHLLVGFRAAEAKDEQVTVGVGAGEALAVWCKLAVKHCTVTLAFDLDKRTTRYRRTDSKKPSVVLCAPVLSSPCWSSAVCLSHAADPRWTRCHRGQQTGWSWGQRDEVPAQTPRPRDPGNIIIMNYLLIWTRCHRSSDKLTWCSLTLRMWSSCPV